MNKEKIVDNIRKILKETFPRSKLPVDIVKLRIGSFKNWDSLGNFNLLLEVERAFKVRFSQDQLNKINSVEQIINFLKKNK